MPKEQERSLIQPELVTAKELVPTSSSVGKVVFDRTTTSQQEVVLLGGRLRHTPDQATIYIDGKRIQLSKTENAVFSILSSNVNLTVPASQIEETVWPNTSPNNSRLRLTIMRLRKKIDPDPESASIIQSEYRRGYKLVDTDELDKTVTLQSGKTLSFFTKSKKVEVDEKQIRLTKQESELLYILGEQTEIPVTREEIVEKLWQGSTNKYSLGTLVYRLRKKLGKEAIETLGGGKYRLSVVDPTVS